MAQLFLLGAQKQLYRRLAAFCERFFLIFLLQRFARLDCILSNEQKKRKTKPHPKEKKMDTKKVIAMANFVEETD